MWQEKGRGKKKPTWQGKHGVLLIFLLDVVVGGEPGPWCWDKASKQDSTSGHLKDFGEDLEEKEKEDVTSDLKFSIGNTISTLTNSTPAQNLILNAAVIIHLLSHYSLIYISHIQPALAHFTAALMSKCVQIIMLLGNLACHNSCFILLYSFYGVIFFFFWTLTPQKSVFDE